MSTQFLTTLFILAILGANGEVTKLFGSNQGTRFSDGEHSVVLGIRVYSGSDTIYGIQMKYTDNAAYPIANWSKLHGARRGSLTEIGFMPPEEVLLQIKGRHGNGINQLSFVEFNGLLIKNITHGPYGDVNKKKKSDKAFVIPDGVRVASVTGFFGYATSSGIQGIGCSYD